ncbi:MAG TPA: hypothetical protein VGM59_08270 [Dongiaceae bacterium]
MRLSNVQVKDVLNQMDTQVIPADHPAVQQLERTFGDHTFFLGKEGLHVVERGEKETTEDDYAYAVKVATWSDEQRTSLQPQPAELLKRVDIGPESADPGNPDAPEESVEEAMAHRVIK